VEDFPMSQLSTSIVLFWLGFCFAATTWAAPEQLLQPEEAFQFEARLENTEKLLLTWDIADGYYLYRQKFKFVALSPDIKTGDPVFPTGRTKNDQFFGNVEIYHDHVEVELPIQRQDAKPATLRLEVTFQGCADAGLCYMPIQKVISFDFRPLDHGRCCPEAILFSGPARIPSL
jgi:thiol:disulfide interchange protein